MNRLLYTVLILIIIHFVFSCTYSHKSSSAILTKKESVKVTETSESVKISEPDLRAFVDTLNSYLTSYDAIGAMTEYDKTSLQKFKLTKTQVDTLLKDTISEGKVIGWSVAFTYQIVINNLLTNILKHPKIIKYDLGRILNMHVTRSDDGALYNFSIAENTGGTYKSNLSYLQFRATNGKISNFFPDEKTSDSAATVTFKKDGFDKIYIGATLRACRRDARAGAHLPRRAL